MIRGRFFGFSMTPEVFDSITNHIRKQVIAQNRSERSCEGREQFRKQLEKES